MVSFRITGLAPEQFRQLYGRDDAALAALGVKRYAVDAAPGFPDRVEMRDLQPGEHALLLNFVHLDSSSPYRSSHAIFVREGVTERYDRIDEVPLVMRIRQLSLRAFDKDDMMLDSDLIDGHAIEQLIEKLFADPRVACIHVHNASRAATRPELTEYRRSFETRPLRPSRRGAARRSSG